LVVARRTPTDKNLVPPPPSDDAPAPRRPRAKRETAELPVMTRTRTQGFWNQRQPRPNSEAVTVIATPPRGTRTVNAESTRAPTARARRPSTGSDDFIEEVPTNVVPDE
jgi:hypothetical protein